MDTVVLLPDVIHPDRNRLVRSRRPFTPPPASSAAAKTTYLINKRDEVVFLPLGRGTFFILYTDDKEKQGVHEICSKPTQHICCST